MAKKAQGRLARRNRPGGDQVAGEFDAMGTPYHSSLDFLRHGNEQEVKQELIDLGETLRRRHALPSDVANWLGEALIKIGKGAPLKGSLGLDARRKHSYQHTLDLMHMVDSAKGASRGDALDFAARYDWKRGGLVDDTDGKKLEALKKRLRKIKGTNRA